MIQQQINDFEMRMLERPSYDLWLEQRNFYLENRMIMTEDQQFELLMQLVVNSLDIGQMYLSLDYVAILNELTRHKKSNQDKLRLQSIRTSISFYYGSPEMKRKESILYLKTIQQSDIELTMKLKHISNWLYVRLFYHDEFGWDLLKVLSFIEAEIKLETLIDIWHENQAACPFLPANVCRLFLVLGKKEEALKWVNAYHMYVGMQSSTTFGSYIEATMRSYEALLTKNFEHFEHFSKERVFLLKEKNMLDILMVTYEEIIRDAKIYGCTPFLLAIYRLQIADFEAGLMDEYQMNTQTYRSYQEVVTWKEMMYFDSFTKLYNRMFFDEFPKETVTACAMIDIDYMKSLNDQFGHQAGDEAILLLSKSLDAFATEYLYVMRYGGDEFVLFWIGETSKVAYLSDILYRSINQMFLLSQQETITFTTSMGVAIRQADESFDDFFARTDASLYKSKKSGRHQLTIDEFSNL